MGSVQGSRFKVQGSRFKVQGSRFKVQGSRFKVQGSSKSVPRISSTLNLELVLSCPPLAGIITLPSPTNSIHVRRIDPYQRPPAHP
ncbi:MAG: hypothetical protein CVV05_17190 [Gammaproteobacteria bacterium HGW-Gammaproteobacteria-1]|nr:MAG: hypothetical protein CVV05_17190 [Gammaproteobacteria bacterium HGW-Gammaproteobacteria-1]